MTEFVSGVVSTVTEQGKDEAWLQGWLKEQPARLGLGELQVTDGVGDEDERSFVATDDDRCFSVDVQLGELEASRGFGALDNWARNRVHHPDKTHVAVLVTEAISDRYQTTLETLAEHLPLVVVELQVWKGQNEAILVPHVALSSESVDLTGTPAAKSAAAVAKGEAATVQSEAGPEALSETPGDEADSGDSHDVVSEAEAVAAEADAQVGAAAETGDEVVDKDDTGVGNPWGLPKSESSKGLLSKVS